MTRIENYSPQLIEDNIKIFALAMELCKNNFSFDLGLGKIKLDLIGSYTAIILLNWDENDVPRYFVAISDVNICDFLVTYNTSDVIDCLENYII